MNRDLFGFTTEPFSVYPDNKYFFSSISHDKAISLLEYGINSRKGFMLLTGLKGTGKTMTCNILKENLQDVNTVVISSGVNDPDRLLDEICSGFGLPTTDHKANFGQLMDYSVGQYKDGRNNLVIIDDAENLAEPCLDLLNSFMDIEIEQCKLIQIILCGSPDLHDRLKNVGRKIGPKFTFTVELATLSLKDTADYVEHRIKTAVGDDFHLFRKQSFIEIYHYSKGIPSEINRIAQKAMEIANEKKASRVGPAHVRMAAASLYGMSRSRPNAFIPVMAVLVLIIIVGGYFLFKKDNRESTAVAEQTQQTAKADSASEPKADDAVATAKTTTVAKPVVKPKPAPAEVKPAVIATTATEPAKAVKPVETVPEYGCVNAASGLKIRKKPSKNAASVGNAPNKAKVKLVSKSDDGQWWEITYRGKDGYMFAEFIRPIKSGECR